MNDADEYPLNQEYIKLKKEQMGTAEKIFVLKELIDGLEITKIGNTSLISLGFCTSQLKAFNQIFINLKIDGMQTSIPVEQLSKIIDGLIEAKNIIQLPLEDLRTHVINRKVLEKI